MFSTLIDHMLKKNSIPVLDENSVDDFLKSHSRVVLFFSENPQRYPESNDVAMALPELLKHFQELRGAIIHPGFEHTLQKQYDFTVWPALAFFRQGEYLGAITGIQNWEDYIMTIPKLFMSDPSLILPVHQ